MPDRWQKDGRQTPCDSIYALCIASRGKNLPLWSGFFSENLPQRLSRPSKYTYGQNTCIPFPRCVKVRLYLYTVLQNFIHTWYIYLKKTLCQTRARRAAIHHFGLTVKICQNWSTLLHSLLIRLAFCAIQYYAGRIVKYAVVFAVVLVSLRVLSYSKQESRAAARKPRDAASVLFGRSLPTTFLTSIRLAMLRKPRFRAPNMLAQNTI